MTAVAGYGDFRTIATGGLGIVHRATQLRTGKTVAIKLTRADDEAARRRVRRELAALAALGSHAHLVEMLEAVDTPQGPAIVLEHAPGGSLARFLARTGTSTVGEAALVGRHAAAALGLVHRSGVVHCDVKPHNLLIDSAGQTRLCDFGDAILTDHPEFAHRTDARSPRYASPEQLEGECELTSATDVYSLGATLCHLVHDEPPTLKDRLAGWSPAPTDDAELAALDEIVAQCLAPDASQRPSADEVLERLQVLDATLVDRRTRLPVECAEPIDEAMALLGWSDPGGTSSPTVMLDDVPARPASPGRSRSRWPAAIAAIALLAVGGVTIARWAPSRPAPVTIAAAATTIRPGEAVVSMERPGALTLLDPTTTTWPFGAVGECLIGVNGLEALLPVDCGEPHDLQRAHVGLVDGTDAHSWWSSVGDVRRAGAHACRRVLEGVDRTLSDQLTLRVAVTRPSPSSWAGGDRRFQCLLGVPGRHLVGTIQVAPLGR